MERLKLDPESVAVETFPLDGRCEAEPQANVTAGSRTCLIPFCRGAEVD